MIAHNEADTIGAALSSVTWADQIVVVDTDSTDETADIARKMGAEVHVEPNHPNLNINKNIAINLCRGDWIFVLDADERIPYELAGEIRLAINEGRADGYLVPRRNWVLGKWMKRGGEYPDYQLRLFRRGRGGFPAVHIHERLTVEGKVKRLSRPFDHYPYPDLNSMIGKNLRDTRFEAWHLFQNGKRIGTVGLGFRIFIITPLRMVQRFVFKGGIIDGSQGLIRSWFDSLNQNLRWIKLWELHRSDRRREEER